MRYIALNGFLHSLRRYFNDRVQCVDRFNWTERNAIRFAKTITEPTTVIGFSDGATAALTIANHSPMVKVVIAHSPMFRDEEIRTRADVWLFRTYGDTTPTFDATEKVYERYLGLTPSGTFGHLMALDPNDPLPIRGIPTAVMRFTNHQFHNALRHIEIIVDEPIVSDEFVNWDRQ